MKPHRCPADTQPLLGTARRNPLSAASYNRRRKDYYTARNRIGGTDGIIGEVQSCQLLAHAVGGLAAIGNVELGRGGAGLWLVPRLREPRRKGVPLQKVIRSPIRIEDPTKFACDSSPTFSFSFVCLWGEWGQTKC